MGSSNNNDSINKNNNINNNTKPPPAVAANVNHHDNNDTGEEEERVSKLFLDLFNRKLESAMTTFIFRLGDQEQRNADDFEGERRYLNQAFGMEYHEYDATGLYLGLGTGLTTFFLLRRGLRPETMVRFWRNRSVWTGGGGGGYYGSRTAGGYTFDKIERVDHTTTTTAWASSSSSTRPMPRFGRFFRFIKFGIDAFLSLWVADATISYYDGDDFYDDDDDMTSHDINDMMNVASVPLVEGRSIVAEEMCDDFIKEYRTVPKEFWSEKKKTTNENYPALRYIEQFVKNCQKRQIYEKQLRDELGLNKNEPVCIPPPGVPSDVIVPEVTDEEEEAGGDDGIENKGRNKPRWWF